MALVAGQVRVEVKAELTKLRRDLNKVQRELRAVDRTGTRAMNRVRTRTNRAALAAQRLRRSFTGLRTIIAGLGITAFGLALGRSVVQIRDFQTSIAGVGAVTSGTAVQMRELTVQARDLGKSTVFSASQAASGMEFLGRAGFEVTEIMDAMPGTLNLAAAGMLDLGRAADIASNVLQAFNLDAAEMGRVSDVLASAAASSNTNISQLADGLKFVAPIARSFNVEIEDTVAALGTLSNAGLQATLAGTGLRRVMTALAAPTDELAGFMGGLTLQGDGFNAVMEKLRDSSLSASQAMEIFGLRGGPAFNVLRVGTNNTEELAAALREAEGEAKRLAEERLGPMERSFRQLKSATEELVLVMGDSGLAGGITDISNSLLEFARSQAAIDMAQGLGESLKFVADNIKIIITTLAALFGANLGRAFGVWGAAAGALAGALFVLTRSTETAEAAANALEAATTRVAEATGRGIKPAEDDAKAKLKQAKAALEAARALTIMEEAAGLAGFAGITQAAQRNVDNLNAKITEAENAIIRLQALEGETGGVPRRGLRVTETGDKAVTALTEEQQAVADLIDTLRFENEIMNQNDAQRAISMALREAGTAATVEQRAEITQLTAALTAAEGAQGEARRLVEATREPNEILKKQLRGLKALYDAGAISAEAYGRASKEAADKAGTSMRAAAGFVGQALGQIAQATANGSEKAKQISKVAAIGQALINTYLAATNALANIPAPFNFAVAAATVVAGLAQVANIRSQAMGGIVSGPGSGTSDSIPTMLSDGEFVINARDTARNRGLLEMINQGANLQGLAAGGQVGRRLTPAGIGGTSSSGRGGAITVEVISRVDKEGNISAFVEAVSGQVAGQVVKASSPGIVEQASNRTATKIARGGMDAPMGKRFGSIPVAPGR